MQSVSIGRLGAICAIFAGASRLALIFTPEKTLSQAALETVYLAVDFGIMLALLALLNRSGNRVILWGLLLAIAGLFVIRTGERSLLGSAAYSSGAGLLVIGMTAITFPLIRRAGFGRVAGILFAMSAATAIGVSVFGVGVMGFNAASIFFGLALIAAGAMLMFEENPREGSDEAIEQRYQP